MRDPAAYDPAELIRAALTRCAPTRSCSPTSGPGAGTSSSTSTRTSTRRRPSCCALLGGRRRRAGPGRRPRPVDLRLPRRRRGASADVDERFGARRAGPGGRAEHLPAVAGRRCSRVRAGSRPGCPAVATTASCVADPGCRPGESRSDCSAPPARRPRYVAGRLRRAHLDGVPWSRMAVIVRSTARRSGRCAGR